MKYDSINFFKHLILVILATLAFSTMSIKPSFSKDGDRYNSMLRVNSAINPDCHHIQAEYVIPSLENFQSDAEQGVAKAQADMGHYYLGEAAYPKYRHEKPDYAEAAKWLLRAAEQGNVQAQNELAKLYLYGNGVPRNYGEAYFWGVLALERDVTFDDGSHECRYTSVPRKALEGVTSEEMALLDKRIAEWKPRLSEATVKEATLLLNRLKRNALQGDTEAAYRLGMLYLKGDDERGIEPAFPEALKWLITASESGERRAQTELGKLYLEGINVQRDYAKAYFYYTLAEDEEPRSDALKHLTPKQVAAIDAEIFQQYKVSVEAINARIFQQCKVSAMQGDEKSQWILGVLYAAGRGVKQSWVEAYFWASLSDRQCLNARCGGWASVDVKRAAEHLTAEQIKAVSKRVAEWKPTSLVEP